MNHITEKAHLQAVYSKFSENKKLTLNFMLKLNDNLRRVFMSQLKIAVAVGLSRQTIVEYCKEFSDLGFFDKIHRQGKRHLKSNLYVFHITTAELQSVIEPVIRYAKKFLSRASLMLNPTLMFKGSNNSKFFSSSSKDLSLNSGRLQGTITDQTNCLYVQSLLPPIPTSYGEGLCQSWFKILEGDASADTYHQMVNKLTEEIEDIFGGNRKSILEQLQIQELKDWFIINS